jgi:hypothetical protein
MKEYKPQKKKECLMQDRRQKKYGKEKKRKGIMPTTNGEH